MTLISNRSRLARSQYSYQHLPKAPPRRNLQTSLFHRDIQERMKVREGHIDNSTADRYPRLYFVRKAISNPNVFLHV